jgi:hypothetical protein
MLLLVLIIVVASSKASRRVMIQQINACVMQNFVRYVQIYPFFDCFYVRCTSVYQEVASSVEAA